MLDFMLVRRFVSVAGLITLAAPFCFSQAPVALCRPQVGGRVVVSSAEQRLEAGKKAQPPLTDLSNGFAWPDTPLGVVKTDKGYEFFGSDGGEHSRQMWEGHWVGNNKAGSVVRTLGTLDNPLGDGDPQDVSIARNRDASVNPNYPSYGYMGGGPIFEVPERFGGAGHLLVTYHAELPNDALYAALGLAASEDNGRHWTDLGEIIRLNQAYAVGLDGFEIGDGPLVLSPDGKYLYLYFPDWIANGSLHTANSVGASTTTNVSVARASVASVLEAAFGRTREVPLEAQGDAAGADADLEIPDLAIQSPQLLGAHSVPFEKFYEGAWDLQPAIGGASTDLIPQSDYSGYFDIHYNSDLKRYVMLISNDTQFGFAESIDALHWSKPTLLGTFGPIAAYPTAVGLGDDPHVLGKKFYVYFTHLPIDGEGWTEGKLERITVTCQ